ncbi:MAG: flavodoxin [Friedmanniella sp.]|nr:flavodoxin [Friedmanniella sp.]
MKILVTYASRMGSNAEIAERIGQQLTAAGHQVEVVGCTRAPSVEAFDAVILGSALYVGRWERSALRWLGAQGPLLRGRPTWLFQSGPCGEGFDLGAVKVPRAVRRLTHRLGLQPPVTFGGRLDPQLTTTRVARWMATGSYAGDFRDWEQIAAWTAKVAVQLGHPHTGSPFRILPDLSYVPVEPPSDPDPRPEVG